jgi:hypothetical protein
MAGANSKPCHRKGYLTVEINQIRYFSALCAERNFSRAALRCGVAQPTVTIGIKALERDLGGQLFSRNHRRAALTPLGEAMLPHLTRAMARLAHARILPRLFNQNKRPPAGRTAPGTERPRVCGGHSGEPPFCMSLNLSAAVIFPAGLNRGSRSLVGPDGRPKPAAIARNAR